MACARRVRRLPRSTERVENFVRFRARNIAIPARFVAVSKKDLLSRYASSMIGGQLVAHRHYQVRARL